MPLKDKLDAHKGVETVWGKLIPEKEAYKLGLRQIAAFSANLFQVMRILEPDFDKRTAAICEIAFMMNMSVAGTPDQQGEYIAAFKDEWNIPEFCEQSAWLGGLIGEYGDEYENMAGRVVSFTRDRVEKELDCCPWEIVGGEMCNMTTAMFTANFDLNNASGIENEVALNMVEARGCGDMHCRIVAERRDVYDLPKQNWNEHMQPCCDPVHPTPRERMVTEGQLLRNGKYTNVFGEEKTLEWCYRWCMENGWTWSVNFPLCAIRDMAEDEDEFIRIFKIVFAAAGKNMFIDPFAIEGMRSWLGVPHDIGPNDGRLMGGYIKAMLDIQLVPHELDVFTADEVRILVTQEDFTARFPMAPMEELTIGYEALWHNAVKTMVGPEWSCWIEGQDEEMMTIVVGKKIDKKMC